MFQNMKKINFRDAIFQFFEICQTKRRQNLTPLGYSRVEFCYFDADLYLWSPKYTATSLHTNRIAYGDLCHLCHQWCEIALILGHTLYDKYSRIAQG
jgi:hypothetical protein